ncbi:MAG: QueT transporter family protein [Candidatus Bathyarchaeota archaeon]|nr:QueT transporter family protein [Candidatus Bathyarchaeota archaeon]
MKFDSRDVALTAIFAALYSVLVIVQGISAAASIQLRIADCLIPLSALFGWPAVIGVSIGCVVGNTYFSVAMANGVYDIVFGPLANLVAAALILKFRKRRFVGCVLGSVIIGLVVGSYIWMIYLPPKDIFSFSFPENMPVWTVTVTSIMVSSVIAIAVIGYSLLRILSRPNILKPLKSHGLKVITEDK